MKIYLSKSKVGNFDDLLKVRTLLLEQEIELLEFSGGIYSDKLLLSADLVVMLPINLSDLESRDRDYISVGRGQFDECKLALLKNILIKIPIIIDHKLIFMNIENCIISPIINWKYDYGRIFYNFSDINDKNNYYNNIINKPIINKIDELTNKVTML